uniref:CTLH domain-containing protein n=1 Tax=Ananas comosus var. bracteatus TaxID=296719 RepID=A0A6V7NXJ9_ANACO|nr:unnamed protein product [Ananas comosus var. bracteatus]
MPSPSHGGGGGGAAAASAPTSGASAGADGELFFLVHQYLVENNLHDTARMFEREAGSFFSLRRFKRAVIAGDWDEAEWYVSGFTDVDSNPQSKKLIFELRRMKYFDTHDRMEGEKEMQILSNDLKLFDTKDALTTPPVRDMLLRRDWAFEELKGLIEKNPDFEGKLKEFPKLETRNLRTIFGAPLISTRGSRWPPALAVHRGIQVQVMECENAESKEKRKTWANVIRPSQCQILRLHDDMPAAEMHELRYMNLGHDILALDSSGVHKIWKWKEFDQNASEKLWRPALCIGVTDRSGSSTKELVHCFAVSRSESYAVSTSGGKITLFDLPTFSNRKCFMNSPPAATFLALHAQEDNIIAIGRDDSSILIYNFTANEIIKELKGHHEKRVTGLAFSTELNVLISSGADAQLSKWGTHGWEHQGSKRLQVPTISAGRFARTKVQFHHDQVHLLVVHAAKLAIYDAAKLECLHQWCTPKLSRRYITHATYSCDAKMIIASFTDGCVGILTPSLELGCVIRPTAYLSGPSSDHAVFSVLFVYPLTIAAHPSEPMRFALGLSNGKVVILEPLESNRSWLNPPLSPPPPPLPKNTINGSSNAVEKTIPESR